MMLELLHQLIHVIHIVAEMLFFSILGYIIYKVYLMEHILNNMPNKKQIIDEILTTKIPIINREANKPQKIEKEANDRSTG